MITDDAPFADTFSRFREVAVFEAFFFELESGDVSRLTSREKGQGRPR
jgi:hypothetical protein